MPPRLYQIADDCFLAQLPARFQPMQPLYQDESFAVLAYEDRDLLPDLQDALGDLLHLAGIERRSPLRRHIDARNGECLALHHGLATQNDMLEQRNGAG